MNIRAPFLVLGIILLLLGILSIVGANVVTLATIYFFGTLLVVAGLLQLIYILFGVEGGMVLHILYCQGFFIRSLVSCCSLIRSTVPLRLVCCLQPFS